MSEKSEKNEKIISQNVIDSNIDSESIKEKERKKIDLAPCEKKMLEILERGGSYSIKELCEILNKSKAGIIETAQQLKNKGFPIVKEDKNFYLSTSIDTVKPEIMVIKENKIRIGIIADTVLGSIYEQFTNLYYAFQIAEEKKVDFMIHLDVSAGKPTRAKEKEFHKLTIDEQMEYIITNYPKSDRFKVRLIGGFHDKQWLKAGYNILYEICMERDDLLYRGYGFSDFHLRRGVSKGQRWPVLRAAYHGGENTPYAKSYPLQGYEENLIQDIRDLFGDDLPEIITIGGQGVFCDLSGSITEALFAVPGMRLISASEKEKKKKIVVPTIGFVIITVEFDEKGNFIVEKACYPFKGIKDDYRERLSEDKIKNLTTDEEKKIIKLLEIAPRSKGELSQAVDKDVTTLDNIIDSLNTKGFYIEFDSVSKNYALKRSAKSRIIVPKINFKEYFCETIKIKEGVVSDTHIGHKLELPELLNEAYEIFDKSGIKIVNFVGDATNGPPKHNEDRKGEIYEYHATALTNQFIEKYPNKKDIITYMITGDHDSWYMTYGYGYDILDVITKLRPDIKYGGIQEADRENGKAIILLRHYNWGGNYAKSYKPQKIIEDIIVKYIIANKEKYKGRFFVVLSGGGHVYCSLLYKGIIFILAPCLQGNTNYITKLGKAPDIGFLIYSATADKDGNLTEFSVKFFDRRQKAAKILLERKINK